VAPGRESSRIETPTPAGKYWCWVFWKFEVQTVEFARASEVLVRAWDSSMNTQPSHLTWNLMGMMNNCHFRIKIHQHVNQQVSSSSSSSSSSGDTPAFPIAACRLVAVMV